MRDLKKNTRDMWYALFEEKRPVLDENGDETGDEEIRYSTPVKFEANLSPGKGAAQAEAFGTDVDFTRAVSTTNLELPIVETSLVWYETDPGLLADGTADPNSADYEVAAPPATGLNELVIALKSRAKNG
ncbi:Uncharacterised protein [[Eubacterium] contortum]|uniref:Uncharacterized protein n=1 Tax=Faecalicatena contorta TaxID=39482 RepID=A0A174JRF3_9FIRM|nr:hypothetical protein [Faecalicatena contorta]CUO99619.1 Uncharacterised protein [[Eubacterium] contortum] [Faecalicatena contorta]